MAGPPFRLDPHQTIINVNWGGFTHVAINIAVRIEPNNGSTPGDGLPPKPPEELFYWPVYLDGSRYEHVNPDRPIVGRFGRKSSGVWVQLTEEQVEVDGLPDPTAGAFSYGPFIRVGGSGGNANEGTFVAISGPDIRLESDVEGSGLDINVPQTDHEYKDAETVSLEHRGDIFTSASPDFSQIIGGLLLAWASCTGATFPAPPLSNATRYSGHTIDFSGVSASIGEVAFNFVGLHAREAVTDLALSNSRVNISILTERE